MLLVDIAAAENLDHLLAQAVGDVEPGARRELVNVGIKEIVLQIHLFDQDVYKRQVWGKFYFILSEVFQMYEDKTLKCKDCGKDVYKRQGA